MRLSKKRVIWFAILATVMFLAGCKDSERKDSERQTDLALRSKVEQRLRLARMSKPTLPVGRMAIRTNGSSMQAIAIEDVRAFVTANPLPRSANRTREFKIVRIDFLASKEVASLLHGTSTGFPDDYPLCYVELQGNFVFTGPTGVVATFPRGIEVFDARTGNFLISGGLPAIRPTEKP